MDSFYAELLKNPLWKEKRRKIILRDDKKCTVCGATTKLQVHHTYYYKKQVAPWCYPDQSLLTVCESCHEDYHQHHELEFRNNPVVKIRHIKEGVHGRKQKKRKKSKNKTPYCKSDPYMAKPSLATSQAIRLGYRKNSWGKWVKT